MLSRIIFFFCLLTLAFQVFGQEPKEIKKANKAFQDENYVEAVKLTIHAFDKVNPKSRKAAERKGDMAFKTGECYRMLEDYKNALDWYQKALVVNYQLINPQVLFYYAEMIRYMGDYNLAIENYNAYKALVSNDSRADAGLVACKEIVKFMSNKTNHIITNISVLNKEGIDMSTVFADKKKTSIVFSSDRPSQFAGDTDPRTGEQHMDLWLTQIDKKGNFGEPILFPGEKINTEQNEGTVSFDSKFKKMFFTRCPYEKLRL